MLQSVSALILAILRVRMVVIPAVQGVHPQLFVPKCFVSNSGDRKAIQPAEAAFTDARRHGTACRA